MVKLPANIGDKQVKLMEEGWIMIFYTAIGLIFIGSHVSCVHCILFG